MGGWETAVVSAVSALIGGAVGSWRELRKLDKERAIDREGSFEFAQTGFRECYRKFTKQVEEHQTDPESVGLPELIDNFREARFAGDPVVAKELEKYWPTSMRSERKTPTNPPPPSLETAMGAHCSRSLQEHLELKKKG